MRRLRLDRVDARSERTLDAAVDAANAYWARRDAPLRLARDGPDLRLAWWSRVRRVRLVVEGPVFRLSRLVHDTTALAWRHRIRFADRHGVARDPALASDARNALFVRRNGRRRDVPSLTGLLVHEVTHLAQQERMPLGNVGFTVAYLVTLGRGLERDAYAAHRDAEEWVRRAQP